MNPLIRNANFRVLKKKEFPISRKLIPVACPEMGSGVGWGRRWMEGEIGSGLACPEMGSGVEWWMEGEIGSGFACPEMGSGIEWGRKWMEGGIG